MLLKLDVNESRAFKAERSMTTVLLTPNINDSCAINVEMSMTAVL